MQKFRIVKLRVSGAGKIDGVVEFDDGLNIIQGRSNTVKTWILKCIYYLFSSDKRPFSPLTGYTDIEGVFETERYGTITISQKLDETSAHVTSDNPEVEDGDYETNYSTKKPRYLNDLWIHIIGLDETIEVPSSARYARERISWTNIANTFFVDEDEVDKSESIVIKDPQYETPLIASLYYLLTGDYKKGVPEILKPEVATAKKKGIVDYIEEQVISLNGMKADYIKQLEALEGVDVKQRMQELNDCIKECQQDTNELLEENAAVVKQMATYQKEDANCQVLLDRYEYLISQYKADLQRMDFIAKGEKAVQALPSNNVCPFCGGELGEHDDSYMEAIQAEITRIASEVTVIAATEDDVREEMKAAKARVDELQARRDEIDAALEKKRQEIQSYHANLDKIEDYTRLQSGIDFVNDQLEILGKKKVSELQKKKNPPLYHAKKEFEEYVGTGFNSLLNKILKDCNYRSGYASWDFSIFDILMDGVPKSEAQGKGYRSFLNSVVALMLYQFFNSDDVFLKTGILMIDTPLLGLDESEDTLEGETIKKGLYQYFIDHKGDGQVIIVDNLNMIPDLDFEAQGVKVTTYYKDERDGHTYGFMPSWRKDLPKETRQ